VVTKQIDHLPPAHFSVIRVLPGCPEYPANIGKSLHVYPISPISKPVFSDNRRLGVDPEIPEITNEESKQLVKINKNADIDALRL
jgi:hypothetical protein